MTETATHRFSDLHGAILKNTEDGAYTAIESILDVTTPDLDAARIWMASSLDILATILVVLREERQ